MVNGKTRVFVLLGSPVDHSVSPAMQTAAFRALGLNAAYVPLRAQSQDVPSLMRMVTQAGGGGNITLPFKEIAVSGVDDPAPLVRDTRACNTFWSSDGVVHGENTDVRGVEAALRILEAPPTCWLVVGTGGSARAVVAAAANVGAAIAVRSRTQRRQQEFESWIRQVGGRTGTIEESEVVINATPLGLNPDDELPVRPHEVPRAEVALDLVYGMEGTRWSRLMMSHGIRASDGREAVVAQGAAAFRCWFPQEDPPVEVMRAVVNARLR
jgi:shikimate dehydrogenase